MRVPPLTAIPKYCFVIFLVMYSAEGFSQACAPDAPALSVYSLVAPGKSLAGGVEAGYIGSVHPFGYFAGIRMSWQRMTDPVHETGGIRNVDLVFYVKGLYRIVRKEDAFSVFLVAAPEINLDHRFSGNGGLSVVFPLSHRLAAQTEFLWGSRNKSTALAAGLVVLL